MAADCRCSFAVTTAWITPWERGKDAHDGSLKQRQVAGDERKRYAFRDKGCAEIERLR